MAAEFGRSLLRRSLLTVLTVLFFAATPDLMAQGGSGATTTLEALPIAAPIEVDGILDEAVWQQAPVGTDFIQREPATGEPASERTEIRVVYTPRTLYIGIRCLDREPDKIIMKEMQRDEPLWRDDAIDIVIDTFDDDRNAYLFETNPNGARTDALITDEGRNFNLQWDGVWDVAAKKTDEGWSAEMEIPFSTLRFDPNADAWGFNVLRYIRRRAEQAFWAPILLNADIKRVSLYGSLTGIKDVEQGWNLNVKPFAVGTVVDPGENSTRPDAEDDLEFGLDVKWGVARGLSLDLTLNTDFGETEADALQVNLTRFSLFFEEKREFFLENAGIFEFGPGATGGGTPLLKVFHSRRIGIGAHGQEVPIEWGVRLTGRVGKWNLGILDVQTDTTTLLGGNVDVPRQNWGAVRMTRNFGERSNLGMIFTNKADDGNTNRVGGLDLDYKPTEKLGFDAYVAGSDNTEPDGTNDWSAGAGSTWDGPIWDWRLGWVRVGEDFDPQMGFLLRSNVNRFNGNVTYEPRPATPKIMNFHFALDAQAFLNLDGDTETQLYTFDFFGLRTGAADEISFFAQHAYEQLFKPFVIGGSVVIPAGEYDFDTAGLKFLTHSSRPVSVDGTIKAGGFYDGDQITGAVTLRLRPNRFLRSETYWEHSDIELPGGDFTANIVRQRFLVAFTPRHLTNIFLQYNDLAEVVALNFRYNWIYRPGADLFVVYNQTWNAPGLSDLSSRDRQFIVKFTYLFQR